MSNAVALSCVFGGIGSVYAWLAIARLLARVDAHARELDEYRRRAADDTTEALRVARAARRYAAAAYDAAHREPLKSAAAAARPPYRACGCSCHERNRA